MVCYICWRVLPVGDCWTVAWEAGGDFGLFFHTVLCMIDLDSEIREVEEQITLGLYRGRSEDESRESYLDLEL